jgi:hypothetical protein
MLRRHANIFRQSTGINIRCLERGAHRVVVMLAIVTLSTWDVMSNDHALTDRKLFNGTTSLDNRTSQFMPQDYRGSGSLYNLENI